MKLGSVWTWTHGFEKTTGALYQGLRPLSHATGYAIFSWSLFQSEKQES